MHAGVVGARVLALLGGRVALILVGVHVFLALAPADQLAVGVVVAEIDVGLLLDTGVIPAIVDAEGDDVDLLAFNGTGLDSRVLLFDVMRELGTVVAAI